MSLALTSEALIYILATYVSPTTVGKTSFIMAPLEDTNS